MATRRMFSKEITDSDSFIAMPHSSQVLYFHLAMNADDDGFVNCVLRTLRATGTTNEDLKTLAESGFVIMFQSGVLVIRHWKLCNAIQKDRYKPTIHQKEFCSLSIGEDNIYYDESNVSNLDTLCTQMDTQYSIG